MTAEIRARMDKVRALMDSPNPGEAAAARARYAEMKAKYGATPAPEPVWRQELSQRIREHQAERQRQIGELADLAVEDLMAKGYAVLDQDGGWYITPADDIARVIHEGDDPEYLIVLAATIPPASELPA